MIRLMKLGSSAFNASYISGAGHILTVSYRDVVELDNRPPQPAVRLAENRSATRASYRRGRRDDSAGIRVAMGMELFLEQLRDDLKSGRYKPSPSRRKLIPKPRQPGKFRPLGIPTVRDRVVQVRGQEYPGADLRGGFWHVSYGFRPGRGCHGALEHIRMSMRPRRRQKMADASGHPTNGSSREISRAASTTSITTS